MSWYIAPVEVHPATVSADLEKAQFEGYGVAPSPEVINQIGAAKDVAAALVASGAVGTDVPMRVSLSGHANPGHKPAEGWANDCITVSVSQV